MTWCIDTTAAGSDALGSATVCSRSSSQSRRARLRTLRALISLSQVECTIENIQLCADVSGIN